MRSVFKALTLVATTAAVGLLGGREVKCADWSAAPGCSQCAAGVAHGHGHGGQRGAQVNCVGDDNVWCPVYPAYVFYRGARKLSWGQSIRPSAERYRVTELQVFPPLPYSPARMAPASAPATAPAAPASDALTPIVPTP